MENRYTKSSLNIDEFTKFKSLRNEDNVVDSTAQQHDEVDVVLLNLGLPLSIVSNAKNLVEDDDFKLKSMRANKNDPTDPFVNEALADLRRLKSKAVEREDFIEARRLKSIIVQAMQFSKRITALQNLSGKKKKK